MYLLLTVSGCWPSCQLLQQVLLLLKVPPLKLLEIAKLLCEFDVLPFVALTLLVERKVVWPVKTPRFCFSTPKLAWNNSRKRRVK